MLDELCHIYGIFFSFCVLQMYSNVNSDYLLRKFIAEITTQKDMESECRYNIQFGGIFTCFPTQVYKYIKQFYVYNGEVVIEMEKADAKSFMRRFSCGVVVLSSTYLPTAQCLPIWRATKYLK